MDPQQILSPSDTFVHRHIGPTDADIQEMLATLGLQSLDALLSATVPDDIRLRAPLALGPHRGEYDVLAELRSLHDRNKIFRSVLGMGYHDCPTPPVIQRNILENPGWYTQYTPYQPEIAQGRLEALLNFQTLVADLTGLPLANASLLDEATAAAEAMAMCRSIAHKDQDQSKGQNRFFVAEDCHPQTIAVLHTRAQPLGIALQVGRADQIDFSGRRLFGVLLQYPTTDGAVHEYSDLVARAHAAG
ncbi:MAG: aminomethyl-transferring glycine dehydrogenase, partial [Nitrospiraceae bacterium]